MWLRTWLPLWALLALSAFLWSGAHAQSRSSQVLTILSDPPAKLDYATAKMALDKLIDPTFNEAAARRQLNALTAEARAIAGPNASDEVKINAVRRVIYKAGPWNGHKPFSYDHADPFGRNIKNKLLSTYLRTRRGNCISMPILFLILADRLGLNVSLASAPLHVFVRYTDPQGRAFNIETTSGANLARLEQYRAKFPMSDLALKSGIYMRRLDRKETVALMASTVLEMVCDNKRYSEAIEIADAILAVNPRDAPTLVIKGSSYGGLLKTEFESKYPGYAFIPANLRPRYWHLAKENERLFAKAEALGWQATE